MKIAIVVFPDPRSAPRVCDVEPILDDLRREIALNGCQLGETWVAGVDPIHELKGVIDQADATLVSSLGPGGSMSVIARGSMARVLGRVAAC